MPTGFGTDPLKKDGKVIGTSSQDIRRINASMHSPGIIGNAGLVTLSKTNLTAVISAGVVNIPTGVGESVLAPVPASTVNLGAPTGGTQDWKIYVKQQFPGTDGSSEVIVSATSGIVPPANTLLIDTIRMPAGATVAASGVSVYDQVFSVPYGSSGEALGWFIDTSNDLIEKDNQWVFTWGKTINLATDRKVKFEVSPTLSAVKADKVTPFDPIETQNYTEMAYKVEVDGQMRFRWNTPPLSRAHATYYFQQFVNLSRGVHDIKFFMSRVSGGPGYPRRRYGDGSPGTTYLIRDEGVIV